MNLYKMILDNSNLRRIYLLISACTLVLILTLLLNIPKSPKMEHLFENDPEANIEMVKHAAQNMYPHNVVLRDLMVAQAILESNLTGKPSKLALHYNNLFGIKGHGTHKPRDYVNMPTKEYNHGWNEQDCLFAWNETIGDSFKQHQELFDKGTKDRPDLYSNLKTAKSFEEAARLVKQDGYATDPTYTKQLIQIYNKYIKPGSNDLYE